MDKEAAVSIEDAATETEKPHVILTVEDAATPGVLTVEEKPTVEDIVFALDKSDIPAETKKKKVPLPAVGTVFLIRNDAFVVVYVNEGQNRFSCSPKKY